MIEVADDRRLTAQSLSMGVLLPLLDDVELWRVEGTERISSKLDLACRLDKVPEAHVPAVNPHVSVSLQLTVSK
jgi:hypothetical protein